MNSRVSGLGNFLSTPVDFAQESDEEETHQPDAQSLFSRDPSPSKLGDRKEFGADLKNAAWELANEFSSTSSLLAGMYNAQVPKDKIVLLVIEDPSMRAKSTSTMKGIAKHVSGLVQFYLDTREESEAQLTVGDSLILIRDYLESLSERGRTVPSSTKHALAVWSEALGIERPLTHSLV